MPDDKTINVTITLRRSIAEKLRAMCYARGETASLIIDRWVVQADEHGEIVAGGKKDNPIEQLMRKLGLV